MKTTVCILMVVMGLAGVVRADSGLGVHGTYWAPGNWDPATGIGGKLSVEIAPHALFDLRAAWLQDLKRKVGNATQELGLVPLDVGMSVVAGTSPVDVYITGGFTFYSMDGTVTAGGVKQDVNFNNEFGFYGGVGLEVPLSENDWSYGGSRVTFMLEALYRYASLDQSSENTVDFHGSDLGGLSINAGFMVRW
jgi:hypothetical protein